MRLKIPILFIVYLFQTSNVVSQQITLKGFLYQKVKQRLKPIRDLNNQNLLIYVIGDIKSIDGELLSSDKGEFVIKLPSGRYKPGSKISIVVEDENYYRLQPFEYTISKYDKDNQSIIITLESLKSERLLITGKVKDVDTEQGIENIVILSQELGQPTKTDKYGIFRIRLLVNERINQTTLLFRHPLYPNRKEVTISIPARGDPVTIKKPIYLTQKGSTVFLDSLNKLQVIMDGESLKMRKILNTDPKLKTQQGKAIGKQIIIIYNRLLNLHNKYNINPSNIYNQYQDMITAIEEKL